MGRKHLGRIVPPILHYSLMHDPVFETNCVGEEIGGILKIRFEYTALFYAGPDILL